MTASMPMQFISKYSPFPPGPKLNWYVLQDDFIFPPPTTEMAVGFSEVLSSPSDEAMCSSIR